MSRPYGGLFYLHSLYGQELLHSLRFEHKEDFADHNVIFSRLCQGSQQLLSRFPGLHFHVPPNRFKPRSRIHYEWFN